MRWRLSEAAQSSTISPSSKRPTRPSVTWSSTRKARHALEQVCSGQVLKSLADIVQNRLGLRDRFPANGLSVRDGPYMREPRFDLNAAGPPPSGLAYDRHQLVTAFHDPLGLDSKAVKALNPAAKEALEAVAPAMRARLGAPTGFMPLDFGVEQVEHNRDVAAIQSGIAALERLDIRLAHASQYIRLACCPMMSP